MYFLFSFLLIYAAFVNACALFDFKIGSTSLNVAPLKSIQCEMCDAPDIQLFLPGRRQHIDKQDSCITESCKLTTHCLEHLTCDFEFSKTQ